uniref:Uncharacterized protein n=1 Tax=Setaria viridis TaxID=4556 RepID=A0A4V6DDD4_SETVI|nr:hypothetical protein SEVIR_1G290400v2 [Setaria viridis]
MLCFGGVQCRAQRAASISVAVSMRNQHTSSKLLHEIFLFFPGSFQSTTALLRWHRKPPPPLLPQAERHLLPVLRHGRSPAIFHDNTIWHHRYHSPGVLVILRRRRLDAAAQPLLPPLGEAGQPVRDVPQRRLPLRSREALPPLAAAGARIPPRQGLRERHLRHRGDEPGELGERTGAEHGPRGVGRAGEAAERVLLEREDDVGDVGLRPAVGLGEGRGGAAQGLDVAAGDVGEGAERGGLRGAVAGGAEDLGGGDRGGRGLEALGDARGRRRVTGVLRRSPHTWRRRRENKPKTLEATKQVSAYMKLYNVCSEDGVYPDSCYPRKVSCKF